MDTQNLLGSNLTKWEQKVLEDLADRVEMQARQLINKDAWVLDKGNNEVSVRNWLLGLAWDMKCVARFGTPSYNL
jgi:hypothetical protein